LIFFLLFYNEIFHQSIILNSSFRDVIKVYSSPFLPLGQIAK
jgi:hypothetical protein